MLFRSGFGESTVMQGGPVEAPATQWCHFSPFQSKSSQCKEVSLEKCQHKIEPYQLFSRLNITDLKI